MKTQSRQMARRQIDKRIDLLPNPILLKRPPKGWIKAMREALGMTTAQLAIRLGVSQPRVSIIEQAEEHKNITLETLERAANAINCELVYMLVPRNGGLDDLVNEQAIKAARAKLKSTKHTMALEKQSVDTDDEIEQLRKIAKSLAEKSGSELWNVT